MSKRLLCLGLLAAAFQVFGTGCCHHPIARWRANHPCGPCACHPCSQTEAHRLIMHKYKAAQLPGGYGSTNPCHGCGGTIGQPGGLNSGGSDFAPGTYPPTIGYPTPIEPGPMVVPTPYGLHPPAPMPKAGN
jgi:hypothetical protein